MNRTPVIIQGGMGAGVSGWPLARAVSSAGQLGVVSGTALDVILARRLQDGDPGGHLRRALDRFPDPAMAERVWQTYFIRGGKEPRAPYRTVPMHARESPRELQELCIVANFVEVWLAREGHGRPVGINYLEKIQLPHLPSIYGAMLAGVGFILMGAGVPLRIPGVLDRLARHERASYPLSVSGAAADEDDRTMAFDPEAVMHGAMPALARPRFLPIVASNTLAATMMKKSDGRVDGLVIEGHTAGGHNAPPRSKGSRDAGGPAVYGDRDVVDLEKIRTLGVPFWLAGGYGSRQKLAEARAAGAAGIQVGTAFAFCEESGLADRYKRSVLLTVLAGTASVITDVAASPTSFPFKVVALEGSLTDEAVYAGRPRICDLGFLREAYRTPSGGIDFRCPAEPVTTFISKGGTREQTIGKKCLCNALVANIGHPQQRNGGLTEPPILTAGNDLVDLGRFAAAGTSYTALDVITALLG